MRLVAGIALIAGGVISLRGGTSNETATLHVLGAGLGILLIAGLWTPIAGVLAAVIELWHTFSQPGDALTHILLTTLAMALALVGPGAWSVDARLFGWKRIDIRNPKK